MKKNRKTNDDDILYELLNKEIHKLSKENRELKDKLNEPPSLNDLNNFEMIVKLQQEIQTKEEINRAYERSYQTLQKENQKLIQENKKLERENLAYYDQTESSLQSIFGNLHDGKPIKLPKEPNYALYPKTYQVEEKEIAKLKEIIKKLLD